jgi:predicted TIM-barrel fold metal-dependent hydrolase
MKLSGAFNEFNQSVPNTTQAVVAALDPYLDVVFANFSQRVMFGSDWPVCNVGGPKGEQGNWAFWRDVVEKVVEERGMREDEVEGVWWGVGVKAYGIEM